MKIFKFILLCSLFSYLTRQLQNQEMQKSSIDIKLPGYDLLDIERPLNIVADIAQFNVTTTTVGASTSGAKFDFDKKGNKYVLANFKGYESVDKVFHSQLLLRSLYPDSSQLDVTFGQNNSEITNTISLYDENLQSLKTLHHKKT